MVKQKRFKSSWDFAFKNEILTYEKCIKEPDSHKVLSLRCTNSKNLGWDMLLAQVVKVCSLLYSSKKNEDILCPITMNGESTWRNKWVLRVIRPHQGKSDLLMSASQILVSGDIRKIQSNLFDLEKDKHSLSSLMNLKLMRILCLETILRDYIQSIIWIIILVLYSFLSIFFFCCWRWDKYLHVFIWMSVVLILCNAG